MPEATPTRAQPATGCTRSIVGAKPASDGGSRVSPCRVGIQLMSYYTKSAAVPRKAMKAMTSIADQNNCHAN